MAAIRMMKRSDKQKEPAALIFSKAAGSKWARGYVCYTTAFFLLPSSGRKSLFVSILRNQSYFQMTSILLICKINKKVAHTDLLGGTTFQIHMSI